MADSGAATTAKTFNHTLAAGFNKLPLPDAILRKLTFKSVGNLAMAYAYNSAGTDSVALAPGDIYDIGDMAPRNLEIWVSGTIGDVVDGEYWL